MNDSTIISSINLGKTDQVFKEIYERVFMKVKTMVSKGGGSFEDAQDVFQDAVIVFYKRVRTGAYEERTEVDGFIYAVSRNLWYSKVRRESRIEGMGEEFDMVDEREDLSDALISKERESIVNRVFNELGDTCHKLLRCTFFEKLTMKEVAERMNFNNENTAKTKHYKCKQRLIRLTRENVGFKKLLRNE